MQADIYNAPLTQLNAEEGPAYGAALLAAVGTGTFASVEEAVDATVQTIGRTELDASAAARYDRVYGIYRGLYGALRESMHGLWAL
jgi:xylulokinase